MIPALVAVALWALSGARQTSAAPGPSDLAAARASYAAGNYEDALNRLAATPGDTMVGEVDEYRALCLLALGRSADAERSLEDLVTRQPLFKMSDTDISPRLITMYRDARKRLLPATARDLYTKAKTDFEQQQYAASSAEFKDLLAILDDEDLADSTSTLADLRLLAEGFAKLADASAAAAVKADAPPPAPAAQPAPAPAAPSEPTADPGGKIYNEDDATVTPPVAVSAPYPTWRPPSAAFNHEYHGLLRVVIDASGHVES
ncbi:MAG TPA: hypothetical protein VIX35_07320, partial [Vicinamibacterales bacterium]